MKLARGPFYFFIPSRSYRHIPSAACHRKPESKRSKRRFSFKNKIFLKNSRFSGDIRKRVGGGEFISMVMCMYIPGPSEEVQNRRGVMRD